MSMISKIPLKFCVPLLALASCAVHADETNPQQFVFGNYGTYLKKTVFNYGPTEFKTHAANQYTVGAGAILKQHHRVKFGYTFGEFKAGEPSQYAHTNMLFTQYDYLLPIARNINLTAGAMAGYQFAAHKVDKIMINGPVIGAQIGAEYRYQQIGFELGYHYNVHLKDHKYEDGIKTTQKDDQTVTMGINYYFQ
ncbi:hypothetical protein [Photobacterium kishitanii]|uniref:hypothetical protein n=1 Tax=Photobacterium kishitanii TaxID=318456 RepID=UPI00071AEDF4|nr:hypothetical protein [Photobacterium kishitanii]